MYSILVVRILSILPCYVSISKLTYRVFKISIRERSTAAHAIISSTTSRHFAKYIDGDGRSLHEIHRQVLIFVFVARPLRSCLFASSNSFREASNSSAGIWDTPGREITSCTSRKAAARRFDVIGVCSRCCALPSSLVGLLLFGPIKHVRH